MAASGPRVASEVIDPDVAYARPAKRSRAVRAGLLLWALTASTVHRIWLGEGALLAINVSILWHRGTPFRTGVAGAIVSTLALALMYAFNDLYDAPADQHNPKKDQRLVDVYLRYRAHCYGLILVATAVTPALAWAALGPGVAAAVAGVLTVNVVYSTVLKGVPVVDVAWCGLWGAAYAAIAVPSMELLVLVGLMTAVCHLYQALGDRGADAENRITTTAVFSSRLSAAVLCILSASIFTMLRGPLGSAAALSAFVPFVLFFLATDSRTAWLLTKGYFGVVWILVLEHIHAIG